MAKKKISEIQGAEENLKNLKTRMTAGTGASDWSLDDMKNFLQKRSITDVGAMTLNKGEVLIIPDDAINHCYPRPFRDDFYPALGVVTEEGKAKAVFLNTFHKNIPEYANDGTPKGTGKSGENFEEGRDFYNQVMACPTDEELLKFLAGKTLKVVDVKKVQTARWRNGEINGTRMAPLPCFQIVG